MSLAIPAVMGVNTLLSYLGSQDQARAAQNAAGMTADATRYGIDIQNQQWQQNRQDQMPWMQTGQSALMSLSDLMGVSPAPTAGTGWNAYGTAPTAPDRNAFMTQGGQSGPYTTGFGENGFQITPNQGGGPQPSFNQAGFDQATADYQKQLDAYNANKDKMTSGYMARTQSPTYGSLMKGFDLASASPAERAMYDQYAGMAGTENQAVAGKRAAADQFAAAYNQPGATGVNAFTADPGYQFRLQQGQQALENSAAARGGFFSGQTGIDLTNYGQGAASQEYQNAYNRWAGEKGMASTDLSNEFNRWLAADAGMSQEYNNMFNRYNTTQGNQFNRLADLAHLGQSATGQIGAQGASTAQGVAQLGQSGAINAGQFGINAAQAQAGGYGAIGQGMNQGMDTYLNYQFWKNQGVPSYNPYGGSGYSFSGGSPFE